MDIQATIAAMAAAEREREAMITGLAPYVATALRYTKAPRDLERLAAVIPYLPTEAPLPDQMSAHDAYGSGVLTYRIGSDALAALRARHPAVPLVSVRAGCLSLRPASVPIREDRATVTPIGDFLIDVESHDGRINHLTIRWWSELAPGVVVRIAVEAPDLARLVRYRLTNAPTGNRRQHDEDRIWSVEWTIRGGSVVSWWTSPGHPPRRTWTFPIGADLEGAIGGER